VDQLARLEALEAENQRLRDRVTQLEEVVGFSIDLPIFLGLTTHEARLFGALLKRPVWTKEQLLFALYSGRHDDEQPEIKIIDVYVCKARKKLARWGIEIETLWGQGYRLAPDMRTKALALIGERAAT
jgi:two-component system cell cycle response regulator CtrA